LRLSFPRKQGSLFLLFLLFWPEINSGRHSVFGRNPGLLPVRKPRKQRCARLFSLFPAVFISSAQVGEMSLP
jgi:hypothetical protein